MNRPRSRPIKCGKHENCHHTITGEEEGGEKERKTRGEVSELTKQQLSSRGRLGRLRTAVTARQARGIGN